MIVYGYKGRETEIGKGQFFCPNCKKIRQYRKIRISRYFTLFYIPLFPYKTLAEYIECGGCFTELKLEILDSQNNNTIEHEKPLGHIELIGLWKEIYSALKCDEILQDRNWPPITLSSATAMKRAGGAIGVMQFDDARTYLKQVLIWSRQGLSSFDDGGKRLNPEWRERYTEFIKLTMLLLTKMP